MLAPAHEAAQEFRTALVEVLRHLNRDAMEEPDVPGLEADELRHILSRTHFPTISRGQTTRVIEVLVRNGMASELTEPRYAWSRGRMVTNRFTITRQGKEFLLRSVQRVGRL